MRYSQNRIWQTAIGLTALLPLLVTASPFQPQRRGDAQTCKMAGGKSFYVFNRKGEPSPDDLVKSTQYEGKPNDLTTLAIMRSFVELNPDFIKDMFDFEEGADQEHWVGDDQACSTPSSASDGQEVWRSSKFAFDYTAGYAFAPSQLYGPSDNAEGSMWPMIIQDRIRRSPDFMGADKIPLYPNLEPGKEAGGDIGIYNHDTKPNPNQCDMTNYLWALTNQGGDFQAYTDEVAAKQNDRDAWVKEIIEFTKDNKTPCMLATNADTQGKFKGETVYTIGFGQDGSILARDVQAPSSDDPLKVTIEDIAKHVAYITHFETKPAEDDSNTE